MVSLDVGVVHIISKPAVERMLAFGRYSRRIAVKSELVVVAIVLRSYVTIAQ